MVFVSIILVLVNIVFVSEVTENLEVCCYSRNMYHKKEHFTCSIMNCTFEFKFTVIFILGALNQVTYKNWETNLVTYVTQMIRLKYEAKYC